MIYIIRDNSNNIEVSQWSTVCTLLGINYKIIKIQDLHRIHDNSIIILDTSQEHDLRLHNYKGIICLKYNELFKNLNKPISNIDVTDNIIFRNIYFINKLNIYPTTCYIDPKHCHNVIAYHRSYPLIDLRDNGTILCSFSISKSLAYRDIGLDYYPFLYFAQNLVEFLLCKEISNKLKIKVLISLDVEAYNEISNQALIRVLQVLNNNKIKGCFNIVGKKIEHLQKTAPNSLKDLTRHTVSYHTYTHSEHPTLAEYARTRTRISDVTREIERYESFGINLFKNVFKKHYLGFAYPGDVYVPYMISFLKKYSNKVFILYSPIDLPNLHFLDGVIDLGMAHIDLEKYIVDSSVANLCTKFLECWIRKVSTGGGIIIIRAHPDRLLQRGSWDIPGDHLIPRDNAEVHKIFRNLIEFIRFIKNLPNTEFLDLEELIENVVDPTLVLTHDEILDLIYLVDAKCTTRIMHGKFLSFLDILYILSYSFVYVVKNDCLPSKVSVITKYLEPLHLKLNAPELIELDDIILINNKILHHYNNDLSLPSSFHTKFGEIGLIAALLATARFLKKYVEEKKLPNAIKIDTTFTLEPWLIQSIMRFPYLWRWPILKGKFSDSGHVEFSKSQFFWSIKLYLL